MHSGTRAQPEQNGARAIRSALVNHILPVVLFCRPGRGVNTEGKTLEVDLEQIHKNILCYHFFFPVE